MKWWSIAVLCAACGGELAVPPLPEPVEIRDGDQRAAGSIAGQLWQVGDARFRIVTRDGRQRVDLLFWDAPIERCGLPLEREGTLVWVRFAGRTELPEGEYALEVRVPGRPPWTRDVVVVRNQAVLVEAEVEEK